MREKKTPVLFPHDNAKKFWQSFAQKSRKVKVGFLVNDNGVKTAPVLQ
jgi:hypothetical protein